MMCPGSVLIVVSTLRNDTNCIEFVLSLTPVDETEVGLQNRSLYKVFLLY